LGNASSIILRFALSKMLAIGVFEKGQRRVDDTSVRLVEDACDRRVRKGATPRNIPAQGNALGIVEQTYT
jgi:hypothetical protein